MPDLKLAKLPGRGAVRTIDGIASGQNLRLTRGQVDMSRRIATVDHGDTKNGEALGVSLNEIAMGVLERQRGKHRTQVFTYRATAPLGEHGTRRAALPACGIENFRWHDLRHTWASWLPQNDVRTWCFRSRGAGSRSRWCAATRTSR